MKVLNIPLEICTGLVKSYTSDAIVEARSLVGGVSFNEGMIGHEILKLDSCFGWIPEVVGRY